MGEERKRWFQLAGLNDETVRQAADELYRAERERKMLNVDQPDYGHIFNNMGERDARIGTRCCGPRVMPPPYDASTFVIAGRVQWEI